MITFLRKYILSILCITAICILCFMNTASLPAAPMSNFDKLVHIIMFLGLSGVIFFEDTSYLRFPRSRKRIFLVTFLFPTLFGGLVEIIQEYLTTTRSGDWFDFLSDCIGTIIGIGIALLINRHLLRKKSTSPAQ